ncbi:hypothetical protein HOLleu_32854 [Holothuria leucospilota]|uniref:Uncharacterized protein n=1 Tax=Holothuria leucospilota TaxID=206669 RepID=A0A9Q1BJA1_HOLLE|nr:hypothetical protein HOLleu_32854 [Holothuria leucospilota]
MRLNTAPLRARRPTESLMIKLARTRSDIAFLSKCKKFNLIPRGLLLKNPMLNSGGPQAEKICKRASELL